MASIKLDRKSKRVVFEIKQMPKKTRRAMRNALYFSGKLLRKSASDSILKKKSGRAYRYKGEGLGLVNMAKHGRIEAAQHEGDCHLGFKARTDYILKIALITSSIWKTQSL